MRSGLDKSALIAACLALIFIAASTSVISMAQNAEPASRPTTTQATSQTTAHAEPATRPSTQPILQPVDEARIRRLIAQLGDVDFTLRDRAEAELKSLGEVAVPLLIEHVSSDNSEIAARSAHILGTPADPVLRVELAVRLLSTTDPDEIERAVHMLFEEPSRVCDVFVKRTETLVGDTRVLAEPIARQLAVWKGKDELTQRNIARFRETNPDAARRIATMHEESRLYDAEAAYWIAWDTLLDVWERRAASQPAQVFPD